MALVRVSVYPQGSPDQKTALRINAGDPLNNLISQLRTRLGVPNEYTRLFWEKTGTKVEDTSLIEKDDVLILTTDGGLQGILFYSPYSLSLLFAFYSILFAFYSTDGN